MADESNQFNGADLARFYEQSRELMNRVAEFGLLFRQWIERAAEEVRPFYEALATVDWDAVSKRLEDIPQEQVEQVRCLAAKGWTMPRWLTLPELKRLALLDEEAIDDFFAAHFTADNCTHLQTLILQLTAESTLQKWSVLILESGESIREGRYKLTIPALLTILEGYSFQYLNNAGLARAKDIRLFDRLKASRLHDKDGWAAVFVMPWISNLAFVEALFQNRYFDQPQPSFLNRHWVLHGRSELNRKLADALRLLGALDTLAWAQELTQEPSS